MQLYRFFSNMKHYFAIILAMRLILFPLFILLMMSGCTTQNVDVAKKQDTQPRFIATSFDALDGWEDENHREILNLFVQNCKTPQAKKVYGDLCAEASLSQDNPKDFFEQNFIPYRIDAKGTNQIVTGYYEPELHGSLVKTERFRYPIYKIPQDLITVELASIYPELRNYRLRGRVVGDKLVPYSTRAEIMQNGLDAEVICYVDSKIDLFFLEVQGSGRVVFDDGHSIYVGYANQNGHRYSSIGRYLVKQHEIAIEDISLQSIKAWLITHPDRLDEVLNQNKSVVFFQQREYQARGALGVELVPFRSVAVDRNYIPLGSMLFIKADTDLIPKNRLVFAQDTGGAIRGAIRADLFTGFGERAGEIAGKLKAPLTLWTLLPRERDGE